MEFPKCVTAVDSSYQILGRTISFQKMFRQTCLVCVILITFVSNLKAGKIPEENEKKYPGK